MTKAKSPSPTECEMEVSGPIGQAANDNATASLRRCTVCKQHLQESLFGRDERRKDGLKSACRVCSNAAVKKCRDSNPEKARAAQEKFRRENPEKIKEWSRKRYVENKDLLLEKSKKWRENNPNKVRDYGKEYSRRWRAANPDRAKENARNCQRRRREDPIKRLEDSIKNGFYRGIRGISKAGHTFELLGYSLEELKSHIERQFTDGMSWENYGEWHVDHKIPLAAHNYKSSDDIDFKRAWSLKNLQPMWGSENKSKGAKLMKPFQPSLALAVPANDNTSSQSGAA